MANAIGQPNFFETDLKELKIYFIYRTVKYFLCCSSEMYGIIGILWGSKWTNFLNLFWMFEKMNSEGYSFSKSKFIRTFNEIFLVES